MINCYAVTLFAAAKVATLDTRTRQYAEHPKNPLIQKRTPQTPLQYLTYVGGGFVQFIRRKKKLFLVPLQKVPISLIDFAQRIQYE